MSSYIPVTPETHSDKSWTGFERYHFAVNDQFVPIISAELNKAVQHFPLAFCKHNAQYVLVSVQSLFPGQNMMIATDGRWFGEYVPAFYRSYPFRLARSEGHENLILCVDEESGLVHEDVSFGKRFFNEHNEITESVKNVLNFLTQIEQSKSATDLAVSALADAGLITEWNLKVRMGEEEKPVIGLYMVDEPKLNSIDDQTFLHLRKTGALPIAYAQLFSMNNIQMFDKLIKLKEQMDKQQEEVPDAGLYFSDDDTFKF